METVFPKVVFTLFGVIPVRDTVISTWIMMALTLSVVLIMRRTMPAALEMFVDFVGDTVSDMLGRPAEPFLPFLGSVILFLLLANNLGVLPFLATPTKDINTPLAMALVIFFTVHYYGIREKGLWGHLKGLATPVFLLPLEIIGQLSRTLSLTLCLFGNVLSSEFIVAAIFSLVQPLAPLPMMALGMISGVLQAYIFTVLALSYIAAALGESKS